LSGTMIDPPRETTLVVLIRPSSNRNSVGGKGRDIQAIRVFSSNGAALGCRLAVKEGIGKD
jgi:hypothetical protein